MFQYAAGLALAHRRRTILKLDVSWFREYAEHEEHNRYALGCFNISEHFATREEIERTRGVRLTRVERWSKTWAQRLHFFRYARRMDEVGTWHRAKSFAYDPEFAELPDETYLEGMWQSEKFFEPISDLVRLHFSFRYPPPTDVLKTVRLIQSKHSVAVHFRRGDYIRNEQYARVNGALGLGYYQRAVEMMLQRDSDLELFVFSDDIDAVEKEFRPDCPCHFVRSAGEWNAFDGMRMMSMCDHAIIANSTFSWWAAWLGEGPHKRVIAPKRWFADGSAYDSADLVPNRWERV